MYRVTYVALVPNNSAARQDVSLFDGDELPPHLQMSFAPDHTEPFRLWSRIIGDDEHLAFQHGTVSYWDIAPDMLERLVIASNADVDRFAAVRAVVGDRAAWVLVVRDVQFERVRRADYAEDDES